MINPNPLQTGFSNNEASSNFYNRLNNFDVNNPVYTPNKSTPSPLFGDSFRGDAARGLNVGGQIQPTGGQDATEIGAQLLAAGAMGWIVGGPVGGVTAAATVGLNAFLQGRAEKKRRKESQKLIAAAKKAEAERLAREEKWQRTNRLDNLEAQQYNRRQQTIQSANNAYGALNTQMLNLINNSENLKNRFAKQGF